MVPGQNAPGEQPTARGTRPLSHKDKQEQREGEAVGKVERSWSNRVSHKDTALIYEGQ